ncbi:hypothetical protein ISF_02328 [Cordyceps fumosorosea ARSEF 2679]|uniref:Uncharacterized protein n=1 Tax=Cordyceps fumosorosea (strain ARSEF 2679) TaxID=1081104 RepID=A0A162LGQ1_CORFA|nr:hypothetical protein ISF_02328 [Cordyceps fumosorosea ARSEF 2679]OAA70354.1 hypothetical protein ISF_02328 [Cordyceps fumosorosea ARSEF 2679]
MRAKAAAVVSVSAAVAAAAATASAGDLVPRHVVLAPLALARHIGSRRRRRPIREAHVSGVVATSPAVPPPAAAAPAPIVAAAPAPAVAVATAPAPTVAAAPAPTVAAAPAHMVASAPAPVVAGAPGPVVVSYVAAAPTPCTAAVPAVAVVVVDVRVAVAVTAASRARARAAAAGLHAHPAKLAPKALDILPQLFALQGSFTPLVDLVLDDLLLFLKDLLRVLGQGYPIVVALMVPAHILELFDHFEDGDRVDSND